jgi:hypoxanthine phosphoribosyltransferase
MSEIRTETVRIHDKYFELFIGRDDIEKRVALLAQEIKLELGGLNPIFVIVLNGAFIFAADLVRHFNDDCELSFIRVSSYQGLSSTGKIKEVIGLGPEISGRHIVIVEDIVDTGHTLDYLINTLQFGKAASVRVASLLLKKEAYSYNHIINYTGFEVPNNFLLGYGLDYDGLGRNLPDIYTLSEKSALS